MDLLELLTEKKLLTDADLEQVKQVAAEKGISLEAAVLERGVKPDAILAVLGEYYKVPTRVLGEHEKVEPAALQYISEESARHYRIVPLAVKDGILEVGVVDPDDLDAIDALNFISTKTKLPQKIILILERDFTRILKMYENLTGEVNQALTALESELSVEIAEKEQQKENVNEENLKEDAPVTKIVATILRYAVDGRASDIHVEPTNDKVRVRFRVDGVLVKSLELPLKIHPAVVARIKILASIRLDEKRKPQDGRFSATIDGHRIDFRVSTLPTYYGEKVVMRILDPDSGVRTLEMIGLSEDSLAVIRRVIREPYGIILISGPTGSGKSTTLYGMLNEIDRMGRNVVSLEDPVEYNIDGVAQSQVRPEIGYTFASGLRSVLRQDPDIIMVGEIRDKETAQLAIQAALTGHLVLSTIHTNNAIGVIPRLIDMGVDPYLIAPTLILSMAQRLVRRVCPDSGREVPVEGSIKIMIDEQFADLPQEHKARLPKMETVLHLEPSPACPNGTRGRIAVMETLEITPELEPLILKNASEQEMYAIARKNGFISMKEDAILKAIKHDIPFEEIGEFGAGTAGFDIDDENVDVDKPAPITESKAV